MYIDRLLSETKIFPKNILTFARVMLFPPWLYVTELKGSIWNTLEKQWALYYVPFLRYEVSRIRCLFHIRGLSSTSQKLYRDPYPRRFSHTRIFQSMEEKDKSMTFWIYSFFCKITDKNVLVSEIMSAKWHHLLIWRFVLF